MPRMTNAAKQAAQQAAEAIASSSKALTDYAAISNPSTPSTTSSSTVSGNGLPSLVGLPSLTPESVMANTPKFDLNQYQIADPLNPPDSLPQATQAQFDKGMRIYEGSQRALKLVGAAMNTTREKFVVVGKFGKAVGAGIQAATELEKVRGNLLDYATQTELTKQKGIAQDLAAYKTGTDRVLAAFSKEEIDEKLRQAKVKVELSQSKSVQAQGALDEFRSQLGSYVK
jgi:hypothetical protein